MRSFCLVIIASLAAQPLYANDAFERLKAKYRALQDGKAILPSLTEAIPEPQMAASNKQVMRQQDLSGTIPAGEELILGVELGKLVLGQVFGFKTEVGAKLSLFDMTQAFDFNSGGFDFKSDLSRRRADRDAHILIHRFGNPATSGANEILPQMIAIRLITAEIGIKRFNTMHQPKIGQELQRPINRGRLHPLPLGLKRIQQLIGRHRLVRLPDQAEHLAAHIGKTRIFRLADFLCLRDCAIDTSVVIVALFREKIGHVAHPKSRRAICINLQKAMAQGDML